MNGISSTLKEEIKKSQDSKKKEKFKLLATILVSNIMVAMLCLPSKSVEVKNDSHIVKVLHPSHQMMVIPMQAFLSQIGSEQSEVPVTLMTKDNKIIAAKAFLHEEIKNSEGITQFKIEISNQDILKVSQATNLGVIAVPYVENKKIPSIKRGSKYEVSL